MTTIRLGATTNIRVVKDGEVIFDGPCSVASVSGESVTLAPATPLPEEPPLYTVVHVPSLNQWQRWTRLDQPTGRNWVDNRADWSSWEQVCALGTPEVLEPDSVKALREQVTNLAAEGVVAEAERDEARATVDKVRQFATACREQYEASDYSESISLDQVADSLEGLLRLAEDEPAEPAPVEELAEWERALLAEVTEEPPVGSEVTDRDDDVWERRSDGWRLAGGKIRYEWTDVEEFRPLTLVETGGQS